MENKQIDPEITKALEHVLQCVKYNQYNEFHKNFDILSSIPYIKECTAILSIIHNNLPIFIDMINQGVEITWNGDTFIEMCIIFNRINIIEWLIDNGITPEKYWIIHVRDYVNKDMLRKLFDWNIDVNINTFNFNINKYIIEILRENNLLNVDKIRDLINIGTSLCSERYFELFTESELMEYCLSDDDSLSYLLYDAIMGNNVDMFNKFIKIGINADSLNRVFDVPYFNVSETTIMMLKKLQDNGLIISKYFVEELLYYSKKCINYNMLKWICDTVPEINGSAINDYPYLLSHSKMNSEMINLIESVFTLRTDIPIMLECKITPIAINYLISNGYDFRFHTIYELFNIPAMYDFLDNDNVAPLIKKKWRNISIIENIGAMKIPSLKLYIQYVCTHDNVQMCRYIYEILVTLFERSNTINYAEDILELVDMVNEYYSKFSDSKIKKNKFNSNIIYTGYHKVQYSHFISFLEDNNDNKLKADLILRFITKYDTMSPHLFLPYLYHKYGINEFIDRYTNKTLDFEVDYSKYTWLFSDIIFSHYSKYGIDKIADLSLDSYYMDHISDKILDNVHYYTMSGNNILTNILTKYGTFRTVTNSLYNIYRSVKCETSNIFADCFDIYYLMQGYSTNTLNVYSLFSFKNYKDFIGDFPEYMVMKTNEKIKYANNIGDSNVVESDDCASCKYESDDNESGSNESDSNESFDSDLCSSDIDSINVDSDDCTSSCSE